MPTIGFNTIGATQYTPQSTWGKNMNRTGQRVADSGERVIKAFFYGAASTGSQTVDIALFEITSGDGATGGHLVIQTYIWTPSTVVGWQSYTLPTPYDLTAGKRYAIGFAPGSIPGGKFNATATTNGGYSLTGGSNATWDTTTFTTSVDNNQTSAYFETEIIAPPPVVSESKIAISPVRSSVRTKITRSLVR